MGKKPKDRRGRLTSPSETSSLRLQFVLPQSPVYGRYPYTFPQNFRRAKYGSGYDFSRATGPWCGAKFWPVPFYRRAWFRPAVAEGAGSGVRRTRPFQTGGRGKPLPYGMAGETSLGGERAGLLTRPPVLLRRDLEAEPSGAPVWSSAAGRVRENRILRRIRPPAPAGQR